MNFRSIVVHPGGAHRDDMMAVAIALSFGSEIPPVYRRNPTEDELNDSDVLVMDVGGRYEPNLLNFDHHHDLSLPCSLHLLMQELNLHELALSVWKWYNVTNNMDVLGPFKTATALGCTPDALFQLQSPVEGWLLSEFEQVNARSEVALFVLEILQKIGKSVLQQLDNMQSRLVLLETQSKEVEVGGLCGIQSFINEKPSFGLTELNEMRGNRYAFSISPDDRGAGWCVFRYNDHPKLDFSKLDKCIDVLFAHKGGFMFKTKERLDWKALEFLIFQGVDCTDQF